LRGYRFLGSYDENEKQSLIARLSLLLSKGLGFQILWRDSVYSPSKIGDLVGIAANFEGLQYDEDGLTYTIAAEITRFGGWSTMYERIQPNYATAAIPIVVNNELSVAFYRTPKKGQTDWWRLVNDAQIAFMIFEEGSALIALLAL